MYRIFVLDIMGMITKSSYVVMLPEVLYASPKNFFTDFWKVAPQVPLKFHHYMIELIHRFWKVK